MRYFLGYFILLLKRGVVGIIGIATAYVIAFEIFPSLDRRLPIFLALFATYVIGAYVVIPTAYRMGRLVFRPQHVPQFTMTPDGFTNDPVNISLLGTEAQVKRAMKKAEWHVADRRTLITMLKYAHSHLTGTPYPNAPMSNLLLFGRSQDLAYQKQIDNSVSHRHHVRFWAVSTEDPSFKNHVRFWRKRHKLGNTKTLWVGAGTFDFGVGVIKFNGQLTHSILANTNKERDYIVHTLQNADMIKEIKTIKAGAPTRTKNRVIGDTMITDGELKVCVLK